MAVRYFVGHGLGQLLVKLAHFLEVQSKEAIRSVTSKMVSTRRSIDLVIAEGLVRAAGDGVADVVGLHERVSDP